ncbi:unnamed protein product [Tuber melanosporum]|uniref:(Perigord truffle) hypothetical protein n=1 Tax=Tuber melanosporum (strain Mel28) TaxID=656061 RepID=D5G9R0_TUBMM|nr:uncharacterized protein GSTUM_00005032001 [Tuber melanosporum]CAZ81253.1 unnamed protein product [Tuber melanosporum]
MSDIPITLSPPPPPPHNLVSARARVHIEWGGVR